MVSTEGVGNAAGHMLHQWQAIHYANARNAFSGLSPHVGVVAWSRPLLAVWFFFFFFLLNFQHLLPKFFLKVLNKKIENI